jgi:hypothetical protein
MSIHEIRILPPLAVARLGSSPVPLANYDVVVDPRDPLGYRRIVPAPTFVVDRASGEITSAETPAEIRFKDANGYIHPVAPFLEVWARTSADVLEPLTTDLLAAAGLSPADVSWTVRVGNVKAYRRTGEDGDRIEAAAGPFSDHAVQPLLGHAGNFKPGKTLPLGTVQYLKPTPGFPGIRLRFTPAEGKVYGPDPDDPNTVDDVYDAAPGRGTWKGYIEASSGPLLTTPAQIFAGQAVGEDGWESFGYLDDECDGLVEVRLTVGGRPLSGFARIGAGPPAFAPDSFPVRTVADELEQALLGPRVAAHDVPSAEAEEIVRRAFETVRLMNTAVMNGNVVDGQIDVASTMVRQDTGDFGRRFEPIMAPSLVDNLTVLNLHQSVFTALRSGTAPWFPDLLRRHDQIGDLSSVGRRKMPALMRGADGRYMALTRRQVDTVRKTATRNLFEADADGKKGEGDDE